MVFFSTVSKKLGALAQRRRKQIGASALGVALVIASVLAGGQAQAQSNQYGYTLFGSSSGTAAVTIYNYNFTVGNAFISQTVGINTGLNYVNGLAWDQSSSRLLYRDGTATSAAGSGIGNFYNWNPKTGVQTQMTRNGGVDISTLPFASAAFYNGAYWSVAANTNDLYRVTFDSTFTSYTAQFWLGNVNGGNANDTFTFGDIAISSTGQLYGFGTVTPGGTGTTTNAEFFYGQIPTTAGGATTTLTGATNVARGTDTNLQLSFSRDGSILYGATLADGTWYSVDTTTGARTAYASGNAIPNTTLTDLAGPAIIPEASSLIQVGLGGMVGLVSLAGVRKRKRRK